MDKKSGLSTDQDPAHRSGPELFKNSRVESRPVRRCSKSHGSGWLESGGLQISRVGSGDPDGSRPPVVSGAF